MEFEPQVVQSINRYRRRKALHNLLPVLPLIVLIVAYSIILILSIRAGSDNPSLFGIAGVDYGAEYFVGVAVGFVVLLVVLCVASARLISPVRKQFKSLTRGSTDYDPSKLYRYMNAIEAVSIGAGTTIPGVTVLKLPTANALSFWKGGKPFIGITEGLLDSGLSSGEIEAVMAHEISHFVEKDTLRQPNPLKGLSGVLLLCAVIMAPMILIFMRPSAYFDYGYLASIIALPLLAYIAIPLSMYLMMRPYMISRINPTYYHSDLLADSLAAKLTNNPSALKSALERLSTMMMKSDSMPHETIAFTQLFVGPIKEWPALAESRVPGIFEALDTDSRLGVSGWLSGSKTGGLRYSATFLDNPISLFFGRSLMSRDSYIQAKIDMQMEAFISWERRLISERLRNLIMIEHGRWPVFEES